TGNNLKPRNKVTKHRIPRPINDLIIPHCINEGTQVGQLHRAAPDKESAEGDAQNEHRDHERLVGHGVWKKWQLGERMQWRDRLLKESSDG
ncbi:hypothetical protein N9F48_03395, partial [Akkermansiaceae bacterium]|nr:hypothetical protein [Akkermansiaceae bacterium]